MADQKRNLSLEARFGGDWGWNLDNKKRLNIGEAIMGEGPGKGFAALPWALFKYERVMRLRPGETWLLIRQIAHAWEFGGEVYLSLRRIACEAMIARRTLQTCLKNLERLGYIWFISAGTQRDRQWRYDVSGTYAALALCIAADPSSEWSQKHGGALPIEVIRQKSHLARDGKTSISFDLDFVALATLAARKGETLDIVGEEARPRAKTKSIAEMGGHHTVLALGYALGMDVDKDYRRLQRMLSTLGDLGPLPTAALLIDHYALKPGDDHKTKSRRPTWWYRVDPRGQAGERPTLQEIRSTWGRWNR